MLAGTTKRHPNGLQYIVRRDTFLPVIRIYVQRNRLPQLFAKTESIDGEPIGRHEMRRKTYRIC